MIATLANMNEREHARYIALIARNGLTREESLTRIVDERAAMLAARPALHRSDPLSFEAVTVQRATRKGYARKAAAPKATSSRREAPVASFWDY